MAVSYVQLPADSTGKKMRTYDIAAEGHRDYSVAQLTEHKVGGRYRAAGLAMTPGNIPANILSLEVAAGASVLALVREISVDAKWVSTTSGSSSYNFYFRLFRTTTVPADGNVLTKHQHDSSSVASSASVILRGLDTDVPIVYAYPSGNPILSQAVPCIWSGTNTKVGQWLADDLDLIPPYLVPLMVRPGESILVAMPQPMAGQVSARCVWDEVTLP